VFGLEQFELVGAPSLSEQMNDRFDAAEKLSGCFGLQQPSADRDYHRCTRCNGDVGADGCSGQRSPARSDLGTRQILIPAKSLP